MCKGKENILKVHKVRISSALLPWLPWLSVGIVRLAARDVRLDVVEGTYISKRVLINNEVSEFFRIAVEQYGSIQMAVNVALSWCALNMPKKENKEELP